MNGLSLSPALNRAIAPLPGDRVQTLRELLRMTDALRAHVLGGRIEEAAAVQAARDALLRQFFAESVSQLERKAMVESCCAMLDMDRAVLECLRINRSRAEDQLRQCGLSPPSAMSGLP